RESCVTGRESLRGSKPRLEYRCGAVVIPSVPTSIVYPSGALLATYSMPIWPAAPVRFSTMPAWPKTRLSRSATGRVAMSVEPPAGKGTIHRIGFDGHRAKVHDPDDQEDRHQTGTALAAVEAEAQAVSPGRAGVGRQRTAAPGCLPAVSEVTRLPRGELEGAGHQDDHTDRDRYGAR